jgi:molybdopterin-guanine dinucleotide biosynthesis protein A
VASTVHFGNAPRASIAGFVTAGGRSSRFGQDKALVKLGGEVVLARMCRIVSEATGSATIIADRQRPYAGFGVPVIEDLWPGEGPLGGIITALLHSHEPAFEGARQSVPAAAENWNLIVSCDMPFLTSEWLKYLCYFALASNAKAIVPQSQYGREPLCACWRISAAAELQTAFEGGMRRVNDALKLLNAEVLDGSHWKRFDSAGRLFWNMNTPADHAEAERILAGTQRVSESEHT